MEQKTCCRIITTKVIVQAQLIKHIIREGYKHYPQQIKGLTWILIGTILVRYLVLGSMIEIWMWEGSYKDILDSEIESRIAHEVENQKDVDGNLALDEHLLDL